MAEAQEPAAPAQALEQAAPGGPVAGALEPAAPDLPIAEAPVTPDIERSSPDKLTLHLDTCLEGHSNCRQCIFAAGWANRSRLFLGNLCVGIG